MIFESLNLTMLRTAQFHLQAFLQSSRHGFSARGLAYEEIHISENTEHSTGKVVAKSFLSSPPAPSALRSLEFYPDQTVSRFIQTVSGPHDQAGFSYLSSLTY